MNGMEVAKDVIAGRCAAGHGVVKHYIRSHTLGSRLV